VIAKGEEETVSFSLMRRDLSYWDVVAQQWALAKGEYALSVGASSRDFRSTGSLVVA
jgi:beta-glucosidase